MPSNYRYLSFILCYVLWLSTGWCQVVDSFDDGDFTSNPLWSGDTGSWQIVTNSTCGAGASNSQTLRLNAPIDGSTSEYISTQRSGSWGSSQSWGFWLGRRSQAATNSNHSIVWLWANESNLESSTVDGYRVRFGDNSVDDEIVLQRVTNGTATNILTSSGSVKNALTDICFLVRVTRTSSSVWSLYTSALPTSNGEGAVASNAPSQSNTNISQGTVTDNTYTTFDDGYFGFMAIHTTSTAARTGAEFDQLYFDTSSDASLPVQLSSWTATIEKGSVLLRWTTASEIENLGFILYRGLAGKRLDRLVDYRSEVKLRGQGSTTQSTHYQYTDRTVRIGQTYDYQLSHISYSGVETFAGIRRIKITYPGLSWEMAHPNPFNATTELKIKIGEPRQITLEVYDITGRKVATLLKGNYPVGEYAITWDGNLQQGKSVASGLYLISLFAGNFRLDQKVLLLR